MGTYVTHENGSGTDGHPARGVEPKMNRRTGSHRLRILGKEPGACLLGVGRPQMRLRYRRKTLSSAEIPHARTGLRRQPPSRCSTSRKSPPWRSPRRPRRTTTWCAAAWKPARTCSSRNPGAERPARPGTGGAGRRNAASADGRAHPALPSGGRQTAQVDPGGRAWAGSSTAIPIASTWA